MEVFWVKCNNIEINFVVSFAKDVSIFIIRHKLMVFDIVVDINEKLRNGFYIFRQYCNEDINMLTIII